MESGEWMVMKYHLCRFQIGSLYELVHPQTSAKELETKYPLRPFTIESFSQIRRIIVALRKLDPQHHYTLLTSDEWKRLATNANQNEWPWGDEMPEQGKHAALRFDKKRFLRDENGNLIEGSTENGLFPRGANRDGIHDLIGNVYDIAFASDRTRDAYDETILAERPFHGNERSLFSICGGAWYFTPSRAHDYRVKTPYLNAKFGRNIGIRLAYRKV